MVLAHSQNPQGQQARASSQLRYSHGYANLSCLQLAKARYSSGLRH